MPAHAELGAHDWNRLNRLLEQALELEPADRAGWLRSLPDAEADLLPLLAALLAKEPRTETGAFARLPGCAAGSVPDSISVDKPGDRVGPYSLLRELGRGGMATVWLAQRTDRVIERQVALKLPHAEWTDRGLAQRLARERSVLAALNHPNIAQLYDAGWSDSGRPYLALEFVDGVPINAWCDGRKLDTTRRVQTFVDVIRAIAHAHARLVVHRDLKPGNVLVTADGRVKLLDFGIAKLLTDATTAAGATELTQLAGRPLTLHYAAPEQVSGESISTATDIFSLGVVLYELLSGARPFVARPASRHALEHAIVDVDPPPPSAVAVDKGIVAALRGDLDTIVLKALQKKPERRYETAAAFADDLQRYLARRPVRAQRDSTWYRTRRFIARNKLAIAASVTTATALALGISSAAWQATVARDQTKVAREAADRAGRIKDFVLSVIQEADPAASRLTRGADVALLRAAERRIEMEISDRPDLALSLRLAIGIAYRNRGEYERARITLHQAIVDVARTLPEDNLDLLRAKVLVAATHSDLGESMPLVDHEIDVLRRLGKPATPVLIEALLARLTDQIASYDSVDLTASGVEGTYQIAREVLGESDERTLSLVLNQARILVNDGALEQARQAIQPAFFSASHSARLGPAHPVAIQIRSLFGIVLCSIGRAAEGVRVLEDALAAARAHHGPESYVTVRALESLADGLRISGELKRSVQAFEEIWAIAQRGDVPAVLRSPDRWTARMFALLEARRPDDVLGLFEQLVVSLAQEVPDRRRRARTWSMDKVRTALMAQRGELAAVEPIAEREVATFDRLALRVPFQETETFDPSAPTSWTREAQVKYAFVLRQNDRLAAAEAVFARLRASTATQDSPDRPLALSALSEYAHLKLAEREPQVALSLSDKALADYAMLNRPTVPFVADLLIARGRSLLALGRPGEALEPLRRAEMFWHDFDPGNAWAAEAAFWYGTALLATGEAKLGRRLIAEARPRLAVSYLPLHRGLAKISDSSADRRRRQPALRDR